MDIINLLFHHPCILYPLRMTALLPELVRPVSLVCLFIESKMLKNNTDILRSQILNKLFCRIRFKSRHITVEFLALRNQMHVIFQHDTSI